jgi:hypothetical protein
VKHMHFVAAASAVVIGLCSSLAQTQTAPDAAALIGKIIKQCVAAVHASPSEKILEEYYRGFDAYYNSATAKILNNATTVGDQKPLFVFQKCMSEKGFPLG